MKKDEWEGFKIFLLKTGVGLLISGLSYFAYDVHVNLKEISARLGVLTEITIEARTQTPTNTEAIKANKDAIDKLRDSKRDK